MLPRAHELSSLEATAGGFTAGFLAMWLFYLYVNAGYVAGERAAEYPQVVARHRRRPRGDEVAVLAGGTSLEELVEGLAIGTRGSSSIPTWALSSRAPSRSTT